MKKIALSLLVIVSSGAYVWDQAGNLHARNLTDTAEPVDPAQQVTSLPPPSAAPVDHAPVEKAALPEPRKQETREERTRRTEVEFSREPAAAIPEAPAIAIGQTQITPVLPASRQKKLRAEGASAAAAETFEITPAVYIPVPQRRPASYRAAARLIDAGAKPATHGYIDGIYNGPAADAYYGIVQVQALVQGGRLTALKILRYPNDRRTSVNINRQALPMLRDEAISAQSADVDMISGATLTSKAFIQSLGGALDRAS
ncbi:FMN-binding protein [Mesorhizobium sp. CU2]|uniref:FMN-binding protein n=1 Tax=unclassified Mesorhizobium TaxID=325217 RepID=UPI00112CEB73|nr:MULTISPECIES: FMN-binding protein [unclassified Mesorhizobium]TPN83237.1 FMN-binding protein [Mesorhizobium sp. CU3]TPO15887.1 FMN-binding protein [Mesorhizobium sp. CU2]